MTSNMPQGQRARATEQRFGPRLTPPSSPHPLAPPVGQPHCEYGPSCAIMYWMYRPNGIRLKPAFLHSEILH